MPNIYEPVFDEPRESLDGFHAMRARQGRPALRTPEGWRRLGGGELHFNLSDEVPYDAGIRRPEIADVDPA